MAGEDGLHEEAIPFEHAEDQTMIETCTVDLTPLQLTAGTIALQEAELPVEPSPFVLVHYTVGGEPQRWGHRLDLDKRTFLDDFESGSPSEIASIADRLSDFLIEWRRASH